MKVIVVEVGRKPYVKDIESGWESLQSEIGGYFEFVYPFYDPVAIVCDEEGKLKGLDLNRVLRNEDGDICDIIAGTFLIVGLGEENCTDIQEELIDKYIDMFSVPEMFIKIGDNILVKPMC